ncbi:MAG: peptidoglycan-associated lipoprotein Pal [Alphaproteobacteria bacterium]|nr:peptidoglycan-associated lipoprotein Pal [Alphaproteobacteria bacterium]
MRGQILSVLAALVLVAACETTPEDTGAASGDGGSTTSTTSTDTSGSTESTGPVPGSQEDLNQNAGDRVFFGFDLYDLTAEAQETLRRQAEWMQTYGDVTVTVEGHCDERGTREYNLALGERRANAVKNFLVALGVDPARVATISYGKERPEVLGSDESAWAQNRRGVTLVN